MPRSCTVCRHPQVRAIDDALLAREPLRNIAQCFGTSITAVFRHKRDHLPVSLVQGHEAETVAKADDLLAQVRTLQAKAQGILETAEQAGQLMVALHAIREARACLELLAKLLSLLKDAPAVVILSSPEWLQVRRTMLEALAPFPEARAAVASALLALEAPGHGHGG